MVASKKLDMNLVKFMYENEGKTYQQIADLFGYSKQSIIKKSRKYGIISRNGGRKPPPILLGLKFNKLTVLEKIEDPKKKSSKFL